MSVNTDPVTIFERLSVAVVSSDLSTHEDGLADVDYLSALGAAALSLEQQGKIERGVSSLLHLHLARGVGTYQLARSAAVKIVKRQAAKMNIVLRYKDTRRLAELSLGYYICPICPSCVGRKFKKAEDAPVLTVKMCQRCYGTGRRPLPQRHTRLIQASIARLDEVEGLISTEVRKQLR